MLTRTIGARTKSVSEEKDVRRSIVNKYLKFSETVHLEVLYIRELAECIMTLCERVEQLEERLRNLEGDGK